MFDETPGVYGKLTIGPPLVADQPENVKPDLVGDVGAVAIDPPLVNEPGDTSEPPFELYETVYVTGAASLVTVNV
jgi:hypothetical protein